MTWQTSFVQSYFEASCPRVLLIRLYRGVDDLVKRETPKLEIRASYPQTYPLLDYRAILSLLIIVNLMFYTLEEFKNCLTASPSRLEKSESKSLTRNVLTCGSMPGKNLHIKGNM